MLMLTVNLRVPPADQVKFRQEMETIVRESRKEPGCIAYYYAVDLLEPDILRVFEIYRDDAALDAHREAEHFKVWRTASNAYPREERTLYDVTKRL
jgi:quinol monooxygenase YgiN